MVYLFLKFLPFLILAFLIGIVAGWYGCEYEE